MSKDRLEGPAAATLLEQIYLEGGPSWVLVETAAGEGHTSSWNKKKHG